MPDKYSRIFQATAGAFLLALASAVFIINATSPTHLVTPHEPIVGLSVNTIYWIVGALSLIVALDCLFDRHPLRPMFLVAWLACNFLAYRLGLISVGCQGLAGYLGGFTYTFRISAVVASALLQGAGFYLLVGSLGTLWWRIRQRKLDQSLLKMACPKCGVHIKFASANLGQKTQCPQCQTAITLRKPDLLKTACYFCKESIQFPSHAIGEKIVCPHCQMDITLKEPA